MGGIDDGMQLGDLIGDALEWSLPVSHTVQDTSKGPHITFGTDLGNKDKKKLFNFVSLITNDK